jgi:hypothetical protein
MYATPRAEGTCHWVLEVSNISLCNHSNIIVNSYKLPLIGSAGWVVDVTIQDDQKCDGEACDAKEVSLELPAT